MTISTRPSGGFKLQGVLNTRHHLIVVPPPQSSLTMDKPREEEELVSVRYKHFQRKGSFLTGMPELSVLLSVFGGFLVYVCGRFWLR